MTDETARLTLAFVGKQEVHRNSVRSLLEDFVDGWQKQHRKGEVKVILTSERTERPTDTIVDLEDWAATSGYDIVEETPGGIVTLLLGETDARLILVGDPNDDDALYAIAEEAAKYRVQTRSLINGLEKVVFDDEDFDDDMAGEGFHEVDVETGDGWVEDSDLTDEAAALLAAVPDVEDVPEEDAAPDLDLLAALADDGTVEAQEEIKDIAAALDIDVAPFETWVDAVAAIRLDAKEDVLSAQGWPDEEETVVVIADGPVELTRSDLEEILEEQPATAPEDEYFDSESDGAIAVYTREQLEAKTFDEVKAIALDHGIPPGRGMKHGVFVTKILKATGVESEPVKRKRTRKPKLETVQAAGEATEPKDSDNTHGASITPIKTESVIEVSPAVVKELAASLRKAAEALEELAQGTN